MKKFLSSVGVVALGATSLNAQYAPGLSKIERSKPWSVSASLRGFYDDNYATLPKPNEQDSFGFEVSPSASLNLALEQTYIGLSYIYSMRYFEARQDDKIEHTHQFNGKLDHAFSERYKVELSESFVIAQEPTVLDPNGTITSPLRTEGDNIRNTASIDFTAQLTPLLGTRLGYNNNFYDYEDEGLDSRSARLDRLEHLGTVNLRWQALPQTIGILGYNIESVNYTADDAVLFPTLLGFFGPMPIVVPAATDPEIRNRYTHYFYVGADHNFNARLNGSARVGGQYTQYYNVPGDVDDIGPYADIRLTYTYLAGSYLQAGLRHGPSPTDLGIFGASFVLNQSATSVYGSLTHRITPRVTGNVLLQYQFSEANAYNVATREVTSLESENFFIAGVNFAYQINPHWMAEVGYNYERLDSGFDDGPGPDIRNFDRNRVYVGIRATY